MTPLIKINFENGATSCSTLCFASYILSSLNFRRSLREVKQAEERIRSALVFNRDVAGDHANGPEHLSTMESDKVCLMAFDLDPNLTYSPQANHPSGEDLEASTQS